MLRTVQSVRSFSATAPLSQDLVQQIFVKKIREYGQKAGDLVNTNPTVKKALQDELNRLAAKFQLANTDVVSKLPVNFEKPQVESAVSQILEGQSLHSLIEGLNKDKTAYIASRDAKKAEELARAASVKL